MTRDVMVGLLLILAMLLAMAAYAAPSKNSKPIKLVVLDGNKYDQTSYSEGKGINPIVPLYIAASAFTFLSAIILAYI